MFYMCDMCVAVAHTKIQSAVRSISNAVSLLVQNGKGGGTHLSIR